MASVTPDQSFKANLLTSSPTSPPCREQQRRNFDNLVAGLSRYSNNWEMFFVYFNTLNIRIGGDRIENVLWRSNNLPPLSSVKHVIILCETKKMQ